MSRRDETLLDLALSRARADRSAHERGDEESMRAALLDPGSQVLALRRGRVQLAGSGDRPAHLLLRPVAPEDAERSPWFLGRYDGRAYFALDESDVTDETALDPRTWRTLRDLGAELDDLEAGLLTTATALLGWHRTSRHCPRCGSPTDVVHSGWARRCPEDGSEHYPRTDPAVIMAVTDADDRLLLATGLPWPDGRVSVLAGFVEAGEPLEAAVVREVREEVGVEVSEVIYRGNQPWPFPASLMLGFTARASSTELRVDRAELRHAAWYSREDLRAEVARGDLTLPTRVSIARALIEEWHGAPIAVPGEDRP